MKAILLAAGKGTRLQPITNHRPKHLLEVAGIPILKRLIDELLTFPIIEEIIIVGHYYSDLLKHKVDFWYSDTNKIDKINLVYQEETLGTGDAVRIAIEKGKVENDFLVIYGDLILGDLIKRLIRQYDKNPKQGYIGGTKVHNPSKYGVLNLKNQKLISISEKPESAPKDSLINAGVYILPQTSIELISKLTLSTRNEFELTDLIKLLVDGGGQMEVVTGSDIWFDIGYPWELLDANEALMNIEQSNYDIKSNLEDGVTIIGNVHIDENVRIRSGVYLEGPVYIDQGADIGPNCYIRKGSYIGKQVRVGNGCEVKNSILYANTHAAHLSYVGDSIVGENCNLGAGTITANLRHDNANVKVTTSKGRISSSRRKLGAIIGDNVKTGISVNILPGIVITSNKQIIAGETINRDVLD